MDEAYQAHFPKGSGASEKLNVTNFEWYRTNLL